MTNFEFELLLPKKHKELLLNLVDKAEKHNMRSIHFFLHTPDSALHYLDFVFTPDDNGDIQVELDENPVPEFEVLGFIKYYEDTHTILLTPKLFKWAKYEKKNQFGKFWARQSLRDIMLGVAFTLSLILTFFQVIEILQKFKLLP